MPNIFQRMGNWFQVQAAEYRYQRAQAAKAQEIESLMRRQEAEMASIDQDGRIPATHKAVAKLAARERLYSGDALNRFQDVNGRVRLAGGALVDLYRLEAMPHPRGGDGIGARLGRLFSGRRTEAQRQKQGEAIAVFDNGDGTTLNEREREVLKGYRDAVYREHPRGGEALEVAAAIGKHGRPRRYRAIEPAVREVENANGNRDDVRGAIANIYTEGSSKSGLGDGTDGRIKPNRLIPGSALPDGSPAPARDAAYRLGWAGYAIFERMRDGLFKGRAGMTLDAHQPLDAQGKPAGPVEATFRPNTDIEGQTFGQISTAGVTGCSVIIIRKGDQYAMIHLDAKHTEPGEAREHILAQMKTLFGESPGDIEIMESIGRSNEPNGAKSSERDFCDALEAELSGGGRNLKVQRLDRGAGKPEAGGFVPDPPGHLEIGITPQDVVFGDRADTNKAGDVHVVPVEWRLGAPQETVDAIWRQDHQYYQEFSSIEAENRRADEMAAERQKPTRQAGNGFFFEGEAPAVQAAVDAAAAAQAEAAKIAERNAAIGAEARRSLNERGGRTQPQAQAPQAAAPQAGAASQREQAAAPQREQAAAPQREHIDRQSLEAAVRPDAPAGRRRAGSMPPSERPQLERTESQRQRSSGRKV
jgi:hypothetical protein